MSPPRTEELPHRFDVGPAARPAWSVGDDLATRQAYGDTLAWLARTRGDVVALDGEVSNSTHAAEVAEAAPERYLEMFIAEQQMAAAAVGISADEPIRIGGSRLIRSSGHTCRWSPAEPRTAGR